MGKLFAILCSGLIFIQSIDINVGDFSKISSLLEHAEYHQDRYGDSFMDFMNEHYGESMVQHENDHSGHENLPFKHEHICSYSVIAFTFEIYNYDLKLPSFTEIPLQFYYKESISLFEKHSVFQPPKTA